MHRQAILLLALLLTAACASSTSGPPLFELTDPRGDDHGDGSLAYPMSRELVPGDLDLLSLRAWPVAGGTQFQATFARPIKKPADTTIDSGGTSLLDVAKHGFYTFNLDIYIDTDRQPGSGSLSALPGRNAELRPEDAWDKAVVLTPRPNETRALLRVMMARAAEAAEREREGATQQSIDEARKIMAAGVDEYVYFPSTIAVHGSTVSFFVPYSFFAGKTADPAWAYTVAVTGADLLPEIDVSSMMRPTTEVTRNLGVLPLLIGRSERAFGGRNENDLGETPIVDLIVPPGGRTQEEILNDYDIRGRRPVKLPGVVPAK